MKAILISIQSPHACNILNLIKLWEIRKKFPKDYVGWVYIYVTKALPHLSKTYVGDYEVYDDTQWDKEWLDLNGKVVARFWCDKVEEIKYHCLTRYNSYCISKIVNEYNTKSLTYSQLRKAACLTDDKMDNYFSGALVVNGVVGYAIHITKLEIFDEPKEISEFKRFVKYWKCIDTPYSHYDCVEELVSLEKAPQSWQYIEVTL